jgi:hypothetical protein
LFLFQRPGFRQDAQAGAGFPIAFSIVLSYNTGIIRSY